MTGPRLVVHPERGFRVDERRSEARGRQIAERAVVASGDCKRHTSRCTGQDTGLVVVAAFGIMNTLITVTVQKRREIGIMRAFGATLGQIMGVSLCPGILVGYSGTLTGLGTGLPRLC